MIERMRDVGRRALTFLNGVAEWACGALLTIMVLMIIVQVLLRYVLSAPLSWSEEITLLLLVWFAMLAVAVGVYRHSHMAIGVLYDRLPRMGKFWIDLFAQALIVVFAINIAVNAFILVGKSEVQVLPASGISRMWLYLAPFVGGVLMTVNAIGNFLLDRFSDDGSLAARFA